MRRFLLFGIAVLAVWYSSQRTNAQNVAAGFGSQTQYTSCTDYLGMIDCGNTQNNVTVVEVSITPGTGQEVSYIVRSVSNVDSAKSLIDGDLTCPKGGACSVVTEYKIVITTSPMLAYYTYYPLGTKVPHFYTSHHSNTMKVDTSKQIPNTKGKPDTPTCQGYSGKTQYNKGNPSCDDPSSMAPGVDIGVGFGDLCYPNAMCGRWKTPQKDTGRCIEEANPPIGQTLSEMSKCLVRVPYPYSAGCILPINVDQDTKDKKIAPNYKQCGINIAGAYHDFCGNDYGLAMKSNLCLDRIVSPQQPPSAQGICPNFMVKAPSIDYLLFPTPLMDYMTYVYNTDTTPITRYASIGDMCGKPITGISDVDYAAFISNMYYRRCATQYYLDGCKTLGSGALGLPSLYGGFSPNALFEKGMNIMYADPDRPTGPVLPDIPNPGIANRCQRTFGYLNDAKVCAMYYGNYQYQGHVTSDKLPSDCAVVMQEQQPQTPMLAAVSPVIIGCGNYFTDPSFTPVESVDAASNCSVSSYPNYNGRNKNLVNIALCGNNDFFCCSGKIGRVADTRGGDYVPMAVCSPSRGCNIDRLGVVDLDPVDDGEDTEKFWNNGGKHQTADTIGFGGPTCQVGSVAPAAQPYYEVTMTVYKLVPGADPVLVSNVTTSNVLFEQYASVFGDAAASEREQAQQFRFYGKNDEKTAGGSVATLEIIGLQTLNGQFAPDFENLNVLICNTSTAQGFSPIYMSDPLNPTSNPWVKIDNKVKKTSGGYTPLPRNLQAVTSLYDVNPNPQGQWFAFVNPRDVGTTCGALGMSASFYEDSQNADYICKGGRNRCVPGWIEGLDWTIEDRMTDIYYTQGQQERSLRRQLRVHTPCVIGGYFQDYENQPTCQAFRYYDGVLLQHLFPTWVNDGSGSKCPLPRCWMNGFQIFCDTNGITNNNVQVRLRVAILGTVLRTESVVSTGEFYITDTKPLTCTVDQDSNNGVLSVYVKNTGQYSGVYGIYGNCTGGVAITFTVTNSIAPYKYEYISVPVAQQGIHENTTIVCDLFLTNPTYRQLIFDQLQTTNCDILLPQNVVNTASGRQLTTCELSAECQVYTDAPMATAAGWAAGTIVIIVFVGLALAMIIMIAVFSKKTTNLKLKMA